MEAPKFWSFHAATKELTGDGFADRSPLDVEEVWLFPGNTTQVEPPEELAGSTRVWDGEAWNQVPDYRGQTWWFAGEPRLIEELGLPEGGKQFGPPLVGENEIAIWTPEEDDWVIHPDFRGQIWWVDWETPVQITELGNPEDLGYLAIKPDDPEPEPLPEPEPEPEIPPLEQTLSKRQVVRAIIIGTAGMPEPILDPDTHITAALQAIPDPMERALAMEDWKYAPYFIREHEMFSNQEVLTAANFTPEMVDQLWMLGLTQPR